MNKRIELQERDWTLKLIARAFNTAKDIFVLDVHKFYLNNWKNNFQLISSAHQGDFTCNIVSSVMMVLSIAKVYLHL